jgi:uncharacterized protein YcbK (DUF882 family)
LVKLSKHFSKDEFECPCGCGKCEMDEGFIQKLETLRVTLNKAIYINSGYRCKRHNDTFGKRSRNSAHLLGVAADLSVTSSRDRSLIMKYCDDLGITRKGVGKNFLHIDTADETTGHPPWVTWHYYD